MNIYEKMNAIVGTHNAYIESINEKINSHVITTREEKQELIRAINAFDSELRKQDTELKLLATSELDEDMADSFSYKVVEYYYDRYEKFLKYLDD